MQPSELPLPEGFPVVTCATCMADGGDVSGSRLLPDGLTYKCAQGHEAGVEAFQRLLDQQRGPAAVEDRLEIERRKAIAQFHERVAADFPVNRQEVEKSLAAVVSGTPAEVTAEWDRLAADGDDPSLPDKVRAYRETHELFRSAYVKMLRTALRGLAVDDPEAQGALRVVERNEAIATLREACRRFGDNDWPDELHLTDIIEKHLLRHLAEPGLTDDQKNKIKALKHTGWGLADVASLLNMYQPDLLPVWTAI